MLPNLKLGVGMVSSYFTYLSGYNNQLLTYWPWDHLTNIVDDGIYNSYKILFNTVTVNVI